MPSFVHLSFTTATHQRLPRKNLAERDVGFKMLREDSASERPSQLPRPSLKLFRYLREINYRRGERNPELGLRLARRWKVLGRSTRQKPTHLPSANAYSILPPRIPNNVADIHPLVRARYGARAADLVLR